jgi:SAM-dependent methyltransferase
MEGEKRTETEGVSTSPAAGEVLDLQLDELDVDAIMRKIEQRVEERRSEGLYRELPLEELEEERTGGAEPHVIIDPLHELIYLLQVARQYAAVDSHYPIGARRSPLGPFILVTKKVIRKLMTPYMNAVFSKQRQFNAQCIRSMEAFLDLIMKERERSYRGGLDRYTAWVEMELREEMDSMLSEAAGRFPTGRRILDLHCGTGDFLAAAAREGREALGVEEDPRLVRICQERVRRVVQANPLDYLDAVPDGSLEEVFVADMGERGDLGELLWMVTALGDKLEREGTVVALNHNPRSARGVEEAFSDPSLLRVLHPETLSGLFGQAGFSEVEVSPMGEFPTRDMDRARTAMGSLPQPEQDEVTALLFAPRRYMLWARR